MGKGAHTTDLASSDLLLAGDPNPAAVENAGGSSPILLLGDHAGRAIPRQLGDLGLRSIDRRRHIACDFGVVGLGRALADRLDATFIHQRYSRLVIDCNRAPGGPGSIPAHSDGTQVPANYDLGAAAARQRVVEVFEPYHARIATEIEGRTRRGRRTIVASLHSFTPVFAGVARRWPFGVLHAHDSHFSRAVLAGLRYAWGEAVGDNQPYALNEIDYTIPLHAQHRGLDYLELEVRQDLIREHAARDRVARSLAGVLERALAATPADDRAGA